MTTTAKQVRFGKLTITNFKGIKSLTVDFSTCNHIAGDNATGKTTIMDAILWVLFGKNSQDAKDFSIKNTVDLTLNRADHTVELELSVDGVIHTAKRLYKEIWTKKRGSEEAEFTGHETEYFWNRSPHKASEFSAKINEIIPEQLFKLLTDPLYFNTEKKTKWTDRRDVLVRMAGDVTDEKIINGTPAFKALFAKLAGQKSMEEYRKEIAYEKTGCRKQLAGIPERIDEVIKGMPKTQDWSAIEKEILDKEAAIKKIDIEIESINQAFEGQMQAIREQQKASIAANHKMGEIENELTKRAYAEAAEANKDLNEAKYLLGVSRSELKAKVAQQQALEAKQSILADQVQKLRDRFNGENAKVFTFDESKAVCPTCLRPFEVSDIEAQKAELAANFRKNMDQILGTIRVEGKQKAFELKETTDQLAICLQEKSDLQTKVLSFVWSEEAVPAQPKPVAPLLEKHPQYISLKAEANKVISVDQPDITTQKEMVAQIREGIAELKAQLATRDQITRNNERINQLKAEEKEVAGMLADLERVEFTIENFQKTKMEMIDKSINNRFKIVRFRLFDVQINGAENPCCEAMVGGVPFADLNHAAQLNAGIDCINALSSFYGVSAPMIIDNAESCNTFLPSDSQLIKLYVSKDKELTFSNN